MRPQKMDPNDAKSIFSRLGILLIFRFLLRVTHTNITQFLRSLDGIVENNLTLKTHQTKRESDDRIRSYTSPKMDPNYAKSIISGLGILLIFLCFFSRVTPTNIAQFTRSLDSIVESDHALKTY